MRYTECLSREEWRFAPANMRLLGEVPTTQKIKTGISCAQFFSADCRENDTTRNRGEMIVSLWEITISIDQDEIGYELSAPEFWEIAQFCSNCR